MTREEANTEFREEAEEYFRPDDAPYTLPPPTGGQWLVAALFWCGLAVVTGGGLWFIL